MTETAGSAILRMTDKDIVNKVGGDIIRMHGDTIRLFGMIKKPGVVATSSVFGIATSLAICFNNVVDNCDMNEAHKCTMIALILDIISQGVVGMNTTKLNEHVEDNLERWTDEAVQELDDKENEKVS